MRLINKPEHRLSAKCVELALAFALCLTSESARAAQCEDILYIGDSSDNTIAKFNAITGEHLEDITKSRGSKIRGPMGIIISDLGSLLLANQNVDTHKNGAIVEFDASGGEFLGALIAHNNKNAPYAPRGMVLWNTYELLVADLGDPAVFGPGRIARYDAHDGTFLGDFATDGFGDINPRGLAVGPDDHLYVSNTNLPSLIGGSILRFDAEDGEFLNVVVDDSCCQGLELEFHRPEGVTFGPDGRLYVPSFRHPNKPSTTVDGVLVFEVHDGEGEFVDAIPFYKAGDARSWAQTVLFGPNDRLFAPISGGASVGTVRSYDVSSKDYEVFVPVNSGLGQGWYLTFGSTNPSTLAYEGPTNCRD